MGLEGFILLLVISAAVSAVLHFFLDYYASKGWWSFASKVVVGYIGAWLGPTVFGTWLFAVGGVPVIPAILGAIAILIVAVDIAKMVSR